MAIDIPISAAPPQSAASIPTTERTPDVNVRELMRELDELIAALDRRVPRVEQAGEAAIARDAAALRAKAFERLEELASHPAAEPESGDPI
jgi:hypothetical protein